MKYLLTIFLALSIAACGNPKAKNEKIKIGVLAHTFADQQASYLYGAIEDSAKLYDDLELTILDAKDDAGIQLSQMETLITTGHDGVIVYSVERPSFGIMAQTAKDAGLIVTAVNRLPALVDIKNMDLYVGIDERQAGVLSANKFLDDLKKEGRLKEEMEVVIFLGILGADATVERTAGFKETIAPYPNIKVTREGTGRWERGLAVTLMENWLQADVNNKIKAVFGNNDEMAIGGSLAAKQFGRTDIKFYGVDAIPAGIDAIGNGLEATVQQDSFAMGKDVLDITYKRIKGEEIANLVDGKFYYVPLNLIDINNKKEYQEKLANISK